MSSSNELSSTSHVKHLKYKDISKAGALLGSKLAFVQRRDSGADKDCQVHKDEAADSSLVEHFSSMQKLRHIHVELLLVCLFDSLLACLFDSLPLGPLRSVAQMTVKHSHCNERENIACSV